MVQSGREAAMPMHDWTRVDPNDYHAFHLGWIAALQHALNTGVLPAGYIAMAEHTAPPIVPDVLTLQVPVAGADSGPAGGGGLAVATAPPRVRFTDTAPPRRRPRPARRRIAVRHARGRRLVAVIEIVSPGNKASRREFNDLLDKAVLLLRQGINLLVIDPFPPTARDPHGLHAAIWRAAVGRAFVPPADKPLTLSAYAAGPELRAYAEPVAAGDVLPDMPLFLDPEMYIYVPLELTYQAAWTGFPAPLRKVVEGESGSGAIRE
jgi:hypothetical protein